MGKSQSKAVINEGRADKKKYLGKIENFKYGQQREGLENPFADVTNQNAGLKNEYAGLQVGTRAAEFEQEANQQSFANVLDTQLQAGGGAGNNATALARAAAQSNQRISSNLQQQDQANQQLSAQGATQVEQLKAQGASRVQELKASGEQYITGLSEQRDAGELAGLGNLYAGAQGSINNAITARAQTSSAIIGGVASIAGAALTGGLSAGGFLNK